jgi:hypothetical protein
VRHASAATAAIAASRHNAIHNGGMPETCTIASKVVRTATKMTTPPMISRTVVIGRSLR